MKFTSRLEFTHPDKDAYENQKKVHVITTHSFALPQKNNPRIRNGGETGLLRHYEGLVALATRGNQDPRQYSTNFPGNTLPGPKKFYVGNTALERYKNISLFDGLPTHPDCSVKDEKGYLIEEIPLLSNWPWRRITQPKLRVLNFKNPKEIPNFTTRQFDSFVLLSEKVEEMLFEKNNLTKVLNLVRVSWGAEDRRWRPETIRTGELILSEAKMSKVKTDWLSFIFELEATLFKLELLDNTKLVGYGNFEGNWIEVGKMPISKIHGTELANTERILTELINLRKNGFAPIVINEYNCNTDGTHRLITSWVWNILNFIANKKIAIDLNNNKFERFVAKYVQKHGQEMSPSVLREVLRTLGEILTQKGMLDIFNAEVVPYLNLYYPISELPVILLPEYSWLTVIKDSYDNGTGSFRVDPLIYEFLALNKDCVLNSRGPYHRTDSALLPWFQILIPRK